jgi:hypothetical protein
MSEKKPKTPPIKPDRNRISITLVRTIDRAAWQAWIEYLTKCERPDLVDTVNARGEMVVTSRWPKSDSPLPKVVPDYTARKTGER